MPINDDFLREVETPRGYLDQATWELIQASIPVPCVDIFPVLRDTAGKITHLGLIKRVAPFLGGYAWCHVGGRMFLNETVAEALNRHSVETLGVDISGQLDPSPQPDWVQEYPRDLPKVSGHGYDPRKHAISLSFVVDYPEDVLNVVGGEGLEFEWFPVNLDGTLVVENSWPGSMETFAHLK